MTEDDAEFYEANANSNWGMFSQAIRESIRDLLQVSDHSQFMFSEVYVWIDPFTSKWKSCMIIWEIQKWTEFCFQNKQKTIT